MSLLEAILRPGGMASDIAETDLGKTQYQIVKNLRQNKFLEWESLKGYKTILNLPSSNIKAAIEIEHDLTNERFILFQDGTFLKRVDYNISNSPIWGYENETPQIIILPVGITIPSNATLRFFYHNGVVRITGTTAPLWYGYVDRYRFHKGFATIETDTYESDLENWAKIFPTDTVARSTTYAYDGSYSMKVTQGPYNGGATKDFTVVVGKRYRIRVRAYKDSADDEYVMGIKAYYLSDNDNITYAEGYDSSLDSWTEIKTPVFEAKDTTLKVNLFPGFEQAGGVSYFDNFILEEVDSDLIKGWILEKSSLKEDENILCSEVNELHAASASNDYNKYLSFFYIFDNGQYSLKRIMPILDNVSGYEEYGCIGNRSKVVTVKISEDVSKRITGFGVCYAEGGSYESREGEFEISYPDDWFDEDKMDWKIEHYIDLTNEMNSIKFTHAELHYLLAHNNRLYFYKGTMTGEYPQVGFFYSGARLKLRHGDKTLVTTVTNVVFHDTDPTLGTVAYAELADGLYPNLVSYSDQEFSALIELELILSYDVITGYYSMNLPIVPAGTINYWDFTNIPYGTKDNTPNYSFWQIIEDRAYIRSLEDQEGDSVRFSPINQPDNFPILNIFQTEVGKIDDIKALVQRDSRLTILKGDSIGQGNYVNGIFYKDTEPPGTGLYPEFGYIVSGKTLFFMDKEDVYSFEGIEPVPLLISQFLKTYYLENVNENSFILENKLENEIWLILNSGILCWRPQMREWFLRITDITPVGGFIDADRKLIVFDGTKFVTYNHDNNSFDENISWEILTRIFNEKNIRYMKKLKEIDFDIVSNDDVDVLITDESSDETTTDSLSPDDSNFKNVYCKPKFLYRSLSIKFSSKNSLNNMSSKIREIRLLIEDWR